MQEFRTCYHNSLKEGRNRSTFVIEKYPEDSVRIYRDVDDPKTLYLDSWNTSILNNTAFSRQCFVFENLKFITDSNVIEHFLKELLLKNKIEFKIIKDTHVDEYNEKAILNKQEKKYSMKWGVIYHEKNGPSV